MSLNLPARMRKLRHVNRFIGSIRNNGFKNTFNSTLEYLGVKNHSIIYPYSGISVKVKPSWVWDKLANEEWEDYCINYISDIVDKNSTYLDVGAWLGPYTLLFSKLLGDTGLVVAFEPDPEAYYTLSKNIELNTLSNVRLDKYCISNRTGTAKLVTNQFGSSQSSIINDSRYTITNELVVNTITLDEYCENYNITPKGIKIDVEGAEGLVLDGCKRIIKENSPWILLEYHSKYMSKTEKTEIWEQIASTAKKIVYLGGSNSSLSYGQELIRLPDDSVFNIFIQY